MLFRVLAPSLRRDVGNRAFQHLQQSLLNPLAGDVAGNRDVLARLADLVDFVNIDNPLLRRFDVKVCRMEQFENQIFYVFANIAGFSQRGGVADSKRDVENSRQRLRQERFAAAG